MASATQQFGQIRVRSIGLLCDCKSAATAHTFALCEDGRLHIEKWLRNNLRTALTAVELRVLAIIDTPTHTLARLDFPAHKFIEKQNG